jgi:hypothetical protein
VKTSRILINQPNIILGLRIETLPNTFSVPLNTTGIQNRPDHPSGWINAGPYGTRSILTTYYLI